MTWLGLEPCDSASLYTVSTPDLSRCGATKYNKKHYNQQCCLHWMWHGATRQIPDSKLMYLFCWTQRKIFWRMWETDQFWGSNDFHSIFFLLLWKSTVTQNSLVTTFLQNIFLCVRQNKFIHTGLELWGWVNDDIIFIFGILHIFKLFLNLNIFFSWP